MGVGWNQGRGPHALLRRSSSQCGADNRRFVIAVLKGAIYLVNASTTVIQSGFDWR